jgi:hypothetical protein
VQPLVCGRTLPSRDQEIDVTFAKFTVHRFCKRGNEVKHDARIAPREPIDDRKAKARCQQGIASDSNFPSRRVGEKLDVLQALSQIIKYGYSTIEQRAPVLGWFHALTVAIEQAHAKRMLQFRNRSRNDRLNSVQVFRRLPHAAGLHNGH